jgi:hypothetical protein
MIRNASALDGYYGLRFTHNTDVLVSGLAMSKNQVKWIAMKIALNIFVLRCAAATATLSAASSASLPGSCGRGANIEKLAPNF